MAQQFRALVLAKYLCLIPGNHIAAYQQYLKPVQGDPTLSSDFHRHRHANGANIHPRKQTHNKSDNFNLKRKNSLYRPDTAG